MVKEEREKKEAEKKPGDDYGRSGEDRRTKV